MTLELSMWFPDFYVSWCARRPPLLEKFLSTFEDAVLPPVIDRGRRI